MPERISRREARRIVREHLATLIDRLDMPDIRNGWPPEVDAVFSEEQARAVHLIAPWLERRIHWR